MELDLIKKCICERVGAALQELTKANPDMMEVRDKLCDAAQFTHFREDGTRTDQITEEVVATVWGPAENLYGKNFTIKGGDSDV